MSELDGNVESELRARIEELERALTVLDKVEAYVRADAAHWLTTDYPQMAATYEALKAAARDITEYRP